ncbi:MAG: PorT family protein [Bacteroidales bacterium]|nr:PorT family protein [Bacteroidales bacterium]
MKKLIIAIAAAFIAVSASAQVGIVAGLTSTSSTTFEEAWANAKDVTNYHVGATLKLPLPLGFALQPMVVYNVKGATLEDTATAGNLKEIDMKTGLLEGLVQAQWGINIAGVVRPYGFVEPFVGYAITNEVKMSNFTGENSKEEWDNVKNRLEYGVGIGFGVEILQHLQVCVRKYWNIGDLYNENGAAITSFKDALNQGAETVENGQVGGIMASVAFLF